MINILLNSSKSTFKTIVQVIAVVTSFLSLSYEFVMWRQAVEEEKMKKDKVLEKEDALE